jgi:HTH-type transcriptional regulator / antitoxin HigA
MKNLKPLRTEEDYRAALGELQALWGAKSGTARGDRLDVLATLIDVYESEHYPINAPDPIEAIKFRMEQQGLSRKDLEGILGSRMRVSEVLNRRRGLSIEMIRKLHSKLKIPAEALIGPTRLRKGLAA